MLEDHAADFIDTCSTEYAKRTYRLVYPDPNALKPVANS